LPSEQVEVEIRKLRREVIGVVLLGLDAVCVTHVQAVRLQRAPMRHAALEQADGMHLLQRHVGGAVPAHAHGHGIGLEHTHHARRSVVLAGELVIAEHGARRGVPGMDEGVDVRGVQGRSGGHAASLAWGKGIGVRGKGLGVRG